MAILHQETNGSRRILFQDGPKRRTIRLGKMPQRHAQTVLVHVERLIAAKEAGSPPDASTAEWLKTIGDKLRDRLERAGLIEVSHTPTVGDLVDQWIARRSKTLTSGTITRLMQGKRSLLAYFGADKLITTITEGDAEDYRAALLGQALSEATTRKRCSDAKAWFAYAVRHLFIRINPFEAVPTAAVATGNLAYISEEQAYQVIEETVCPDARLLFILARWGGLRIPSEAKALTFDMIHWAANRADEKITVLSRKTKRYAGKEKRTIPLYPELVKPLQDALERAEPGQVYVLPRLQQVSGAALRKPLQRAIERAGLKNWPRLWNNLRSSRQTDLEREYASHIVCLWMGNNEKTARRHYLQVLPSDYARATGRGEKVARFPAQQMQETPENKAKMTEAENEKSREIPEKSGVFAAFPQFPAVSSDPDGIPINPVFSGKNSHFGKTGTISGTVTSHDLDQVIAAWPHLTPFEQASVLAVVRRSRRRLTAALRPQDADRQTEGGKFPSPGGGGRGEGETAHRRRSISPQAITQGPRKQP